MTLTEIAIYRDAPRRKTDQRLLEGSPQIAKNRRLAVR